MTPDKYSERNIVNSAALYLAAKLLAKGYLIYWHKVDALQISTAASGWYFQFTPNKAAYLADATVAAAVSGAKGVVTVVDGLPAVPRFITRLISDDSLGQDDAITVPAISVECSPVLLTSRYELGSTVKWRSRHLLVDAYVRDDDEQASFKDWFALWFEQDTVIDVYDHEGSLDPVGPLDLNQVRVDADRFADGAEATTYQVLAQAVAEYVA